MHVMSKTASKNRTDQALGYTIQAAAQRHGDVPIQLDRPLGIAPELGLKFGYRAMGDLVERFAAALHAAGVRPGERVAVNKSHNADILVIACACARLGALSCLLSPAIDGETVLDMLAKAKPDHLITDADHLGHLGMTVVDLLEVTPSVLLAEGRLPGATALSDFLPRTMSEVRPAPHPTIDPDAPTFITHTSGTTGEPKLVAQSGRGLGAHIKLQKRIAKLLRINEPYALCVSYVHARTYSALAVAMSRGVPLLFLIDHQLPNVRKMFAEFRPGIVETNPNIFIQWEELAEDADRPLGNVRYYVSTFDAIHPRTVQRLLNGSNRRGAMYLQAYGQTESGPVTVRPYTRKSARRADGRCVGYGIPGLTAVRIGGEKPGRLSRTPGPVHVRSKGLGMTYVGQESRFSEQYDGTWWNMRDIGHRSKYGCLHLLDREVDQVAELDSVLALEDVLINRLDQLTEVVLVPLDDRISPVVCTRHDNSLDLGAWRKAVADLPSMSEPVHCRWEDLPQTATWKVKRLELRRQMQDGTLVTVNG